MSLTTVRRQRWLLPTGVFVAVVLVHFLYLAFFPERDPAQTRWATVPVRENAWFKTYIETQSYWLGFSYGFSLAFAVAAFRRYREGRSCTARNMVIGGVSFTGVLSVVGCYLLGCCGSPMLGVYISLFGAAFVPWAKPLAAALTVLSIGTAWWWMNRRLARSESPATDGACSGPNCNCQAQHS